jgi:hypothetical protein
MVVVVCVAIDLGMDDSSEDGESKREVMRGGVVASPTSRVGFF